MSNNEILMKLAASADKLIDWSTSIASKSETFIVEQTPLLVQEYVSWIFWENVLWGSLKGFVALFLFIILTILVKMTWTALSKNTEEAGGCLLLSAVIGGLTIFTAIGTMSDIVMAVKCKVAPRVVIVEKIAELAKSMSGGTSENRR